jgi:hypothetical protein
LEFSATPYDSLYVLALLPAGVLSPNVAGFGLGVGVGVGNADDDIGGGVVYWLGQIDPITPSDVNGIGGFARLTTPIMLLYRVLLGSALANIGAGASDAMVQEVGLDVPESTMTSFPPFIAYWLNVVARHNPGRGLAVIQVLVALFPCKNEYGYHWPFGD